jgi:tetratricopeptide (TPR) repeat protein
MNRITLFILLFFLPASSMLAQRTAFDVDPRRDWEQAVQWFYEGKESLAYPIFLRLHEWRLDARQSAVSESELDYFRLICGVRMDELSAVEEAGRYIRQPHPPAFVQGLSYELADHSFRNQRFPEALHLLEDLEPRNLRSAERTHRQFMMGYAHFIAQRFAPARSNFDSVRSQLKHPDYAAANYYFGFICLKDQQYNLALSSLRLVEDHPEYLSIVPYYIGQLFYLQGKKKEAIDYVERKLQEPGSQYYELPLKQLLGHAYFEKRAFDKALPLLKEYVARSEKVRREDVYELSYCHHQSGDYKSSIPGFQELAGGQDSLSQHAMYLLGDAYLKTGDLSRARNAFQFCARNNSYADQRSISLLQYAKLSYELSFLQEAQISVEQFLANYPADTRREEAQELMVMVLAATNNFRQALQWVERIERPSSSLKKLFPRIWYGRAMELLNDQLLDRSQILLDQVIQDPWAGQWRQYAKFWSGEIAYRRNDPANAINHLNAYLTDPLSIGTEVNATHARYNLGYAYIRLSNYSAAGDQFLSITKNMPGIPTSLLQDAWLRAGDCFYMRRDFNKAKTHYERAITMQWPAADYAQFQLAMITGIKNVAEKIRLLQQIPEKYPRSVLLPDAYLEMANAYVADRKFREAIPALDRVIVHASQDSWISRALLLQGSCLYNLDEYEESLKRLKEVVSRFPNGEDADDALENIRQVFVEMGKPADFVGYMQSIGKPLEYPVADSLTYMAAAAMYENGAEGNALSALKSYLSEHPNGRYRIQAFYQVAELFIKKKDWASALMQLDSLLARTPNKYEEWSYRQAARISYFELKNAKDALRFYLGLLGVTRNQEWRLEALRGSVRCYQQLKDWVNGAKQARSLLAEKDASSDDKAISYMLIAQQSIEVKQWEEALEALRLVLPHNKGALAAEARYLMAWAYFQQGNWQEAEKAATETIRRSGSYEPWSTKSYILTGDVYFQTKDFFNAKATYQSVIDNAEDPLLQAEATEKLQRVVEAERKTTKTGL